MSVLEIILIVVGALLLVVLLFLLVGYLGARRRDRRRSGVYEEHVAAADRALEDARAADKGWHRDALEAAARVGLDRERPDFAVKELHLVLVDDRPGVAEDRARFVAVGSDEELNLTLGRSQGGDWELERLD